MKRLNTALVFFLMSFSAFIFSMEVCRVFADVGESNESAGRVTITFLKDVVSQGNRLYLADFSSCAGDVSFCREASGIDIQMSPAPGRTSIVSQTTVLKILNKEWPNVLVSFVGPETTKVTAANAEVRTEEIRLNLQNWIKTQVDFSQDIKVNVTKVVIPMGSGIRPSQTKVEFPDLEGIPFNQIDWLSRNLSGVRLTQFKFQNPSDSDDYQLVSGQAHFSLERFMPVAARPISSGAVIATRDIVQQWVTIKRGPSEFADQVEQIVGRKIRNVISSGDPFNVRYLDEAILVARNQPVTIIMKNAGVEITAKATSIDAGVKGQVVDVVNVANKKRIRAKVIDSQTVEAIAF